VKPVISTDPTPPNIAKVITFLSDTPQALMALSQRYSLTQLDQPLGVGERSATQVLAHLLNCEARSAEAMYLALLADEPLLVDLHPERQWGKLMQYDQFVFSDLLAYFKLRRQMLLGVLNRLTEVQWSRAIREAKKQRKESVYWRARSLALHELEHLAEIGQGGK